MSAERCSDLSRAAGEPLSATATRASHWLLVEARGTWPRDVSSGDGLPERARDTVTRWLERTPKSRLLFVRRPRRTSERRLVFVVRAQEAEQAVRRIELARLDKLAACDLDVDGNLTEARLVRVCAHGSRDPCCALRGTAVFGALAGELAEEELWLSSHHGGHRFAANVLVLPTGLHLGRVEPTAASGVVSSALAGTIELACYRGRTCYEPTVQAAERAVREATGRVGVFDLRLIGADGPRVSFEDADGTVYSARVEEAAGPRVPASCGAQPEPQAALTAWIT